MKRSALLLAGWIAACASAPAQSERRTAPPARSPPKTSPPVAKRAEPPARPPPKEDPPPPELPPPPAPDLALMRTRFERSPKSGTAEWIWPVDGVVISLFGRRDGERHDGIDIGAPEGSAIWAAAPGKVVFSGEQPGYGRLVILAHDGDLATVYAHNAANLVKDGDLVKQGDPIAQVGKSGGQTTPALHFELRVNKEPVNPLSRLPE